MLWGCGLLGLQGFSDSDEIGSAGRRDGCIGFYGFDVGGEIIGGGKGGG
jgi:hypothetical protein